MFMRVGILYLCFNDIYKHNILTLSENIKFICTNFRNRSKSESLARISVLFHSECEYILHVPTMYVYFVYPAMLKQLPNGLKRAEISIVLCVNTATVSYCCST